MVNRRSLNRGTAAAVVATGIAPLGTDPLGARAASRPLAGLRDHLRGDLVLPGDAGYEVAKQVHFSSYDSSRPMGVAYCETVQDVRTCLAFAQQEGIPAVARSGGHSYAGFSTTSGLVVDLSRFNRVQVGASTAVMGAGVQAVDLIDALAAHGRGAASGLCPTVAMGGYLQGGGIGWQTRAMGVAADSLLAAQVVLSSGEVVTCSNTVRPDLFWALRGGGGGNFGVVTRYERRHVAVTNMVNFTLVWSWDRAADVIRAWQEWSPETPWALSSRWLLALFDAAPGQVPQVIVNGAFLGPATTLATQLDGLVAAVGAQPLVRNAADFAFKAGMMNWYDCDNRTVPQCHTVGYNPEAQLPRTSFIIDRSRLFSGSLPVAGTDQLLAAFDADRRAGQARFAQALALGGRANTVARSATAYVHRDARFTANLTVALPTPTPSTDERDAAQAWIDASFAVLDPYSTRETYQNYVDPHLADWRHAYYAENYPRLVAVKRAVDPHNFFNFAQSIG